MTARTARAVAGGAVLLAALALVVRHGLLTDHLVNHDVALYLQCARLLLDGAVPYVDYVEINPPLVHYLHVLPVLLARWTGVGVATASHLFVLGLVAYSTAAVFVLPARARLLDEPGSRLLTAGAWLAASVWTLGVGEFGQREHLFVLAWVPWMLLRQLRCGGGRVGPASAVLVGAVAAPFVLLKPQFLALAVVLDLWVMARNRQWRAAIAPEVLVAAAAALLYALHFALVPGEMRDELFRRWAPAIAEHYRAYELGTARLLAALPAGFWMAAGAAAVALPFARRGAPRHVAVHLEVLTGGFALGLAVYFLQGKGWEYHQIPSVFLLALLVASAVLLSAERGARLLRGALFTALCLAVLAVALGSSASARRFTLSGRPDLAGLIDLLRDTTRPDDRVLFLSTSVFPAYPALVYADRLPGSRYPCAFPFAFNYDGVARERGRARFPYRSRSAMPEEERRFLDELAEDVETLRPKLALIQHGPCQACPEGFEILEYLETTGWVDDAMRGYAPAGSFKNLSILLRTP